ncbi:MAG: protocatechuate 3,4-dioxygenase subunit alpha, partial [Aestuariivirgaceae bacterium]
MTTGQTPSQTVGPFFALGLTAGQYGYPFTSIAGPDLVRPDTGGDRITISGRVLDGEGAPVSDALVEIWQADAAGNYAGRGGNTSFAGFGRTGTGVDAKNRSVFHTIKPGCVAKNEAPHINGIVFMRCALTHLFT